jgi:archaeal chaperonin
MCSLESFTVGDEQLWSITGSACGGATILARAHSLVAMDECEQSLHDTLCVLLRCIEQPKLVGGAGSLFVAAARHLRQQAKICNAAWMAGLEAFAQALECIPLTLTRNGTHDAIRERERERERDESHY